MAADQVTISDEPKGGSVTAEAAVKAIKAGRNKDVDIAAQIISDYADQMDGDSWSVEEERKLIRRIDWRLIPTVRNPVYDREYRSILIYNSYSSVLLCRGLIKLLSRRLPFTTSRRIFILPGISIHGLDPHRSSVGWYSWVLWPTVCKSETPSMIIFETLRTNSYLTY